MDAKLVFFAAGCIPGAGLGRARTEGDVRRIVNAQKSEGNIASIFATKPLFSMGQDAEKHKVDLITNLLTGPSPMQFLLKAYSPWRQISTAISGHHAAAGDESGSQLSAHRFAQRQSTDPRQHAGDGIAGGGQYYAIRVMPSGRSWPPCSVLIPQCLTSSGRGPWWRVALRCGMRCNPAYAPAAWIPPSTRAR